MPDIITEVFKYIGYRTQRLHTIKNAGSHKIRLLTFIIIITTIKPKIVGTLFR